MLARAITCSTATGLVALALLAGASAGCGEQELTCDDLSGDTLLMIGDSDAEGGFVELADGTAIEAECRASGFWLLTTSVRAYGLLPGVDGRFGDPADPLILVEAFVGAELVGASSPEGQHVGLEQVGEAAELHSIPIVLDGRRCNELPVDLIGETVLVTAELTDACGNRASAELSAVIVNDETF